MFSGTGSRVLLAVAVLLTAGMRAAAQVQVGNDVSLNLNGSVATGYSASYGDSFPSGHGFTFGGNADLSGSYYDPNFLSFHINPYANQSRENSNFQSITNSSGVTASASIFGGSHYPGWVNFSRTYNGTGTYAVPGLADYVAHGNARSFGIGWSETRADLPMVTVSYQQGLSDYSVFGTSSDSSVRYHTFAATASDTVKGFHLNADYHYGNSNSLYPQVLTGQLLQSFRTNNNAYSLGASHQLVWRGLASIHFNQTDYGYKSDFAKNSGTVRTLDGYASANPTEKLSLDATAYYTDNLLGTLYQTIVNTGGSLLLTTPGSSSSAFSVMGNVVYSIRDGLRVIVRADHRQQMYANGSFGANSIGGVVTYFHFLWGGRFNATQSVSETFLDYNHEKSLGSTSSLGYSRSIGRWNAAGSFNLFQNQQTLLVTYTNSGYSYSSTLGRKLGWKAYWNMGANGSKSLYSSQAGWGYFNQTYTVALTMPRIGASASYTKSSGNGILTGTGVVPTPVPGPVLPFPVLLYGGESYSYSLGGSPIRRMTFTATYTRAKSNTSSPLENSSNLSELANVHIQYQFRKLYFNAGYSRLLQGFSASNTPPAAANSYYAGISRWFNFF